MPGFFDGVLAEATNGLDFAIISQKVVLDIGFATQSLSGTTTITAQPLTKDLKSFRLNCRQCKVTRATVDGRPAVINYADPYERLNSSRGAPTVHQHEALRSKIERQIKEYPEPELVISLPSRMSVQELQGDDDAPLIARNGSLHRQESDAFAHAETPTLQTAQEHGPRYAPMKIYIEFRVDSFRDGLHFVGFNNDDTRYPHLYTRNTAIPGTICSVFPCLDDPSSRCMWVLSIKCPRTLEDAFKKPAPKVNGVNGEAHTVTALTNGEAEHDAEHSKSPAAELVLGLSDEERALELSIVCSGEMTDDITDPEDPSKRTVSFACTTPVAARHVAFAIGPFEQVDLSEFREVDEDEKLGQSAIRVHGFCLPGRADELRNTCMPMAKAIDFFTVSYGSFPFPTYKLCFVDDLVNDVADTAGLSICSNRLLFPEDIIEPLDPNTRTLVRALASQYVGVNIIPKEATDMWTITGISGFMTDMFMKKLAGNNEFRYGQKLGSQEIYELDVDRYSIHQLGAQLDIDPSEYDFLAKKSALVLFILDRRLTKASGSSGVSRIVNRVFLNAKTGDLENGQISTDYFHRTCEKLGHQKLDSFFKQWVYGAGCPEFSVIQRFNKKKLVVEIMVEQIQIARTTKPRLQPSTFMREAKEQVSEAWVTIQPVFTGPMTIRIHEADGTPYEHIVEVKEQKQMFYIPYNTKYKRLKRSRRQKDRAIASGGPEQAGDGQDDVLLYCLGDTLQSEEDVKDWRLVDWTKDEETKMGLESYEWIRMDADFEWIGKFATNMPVYMYVSQLQQDRDVVAQYESLENIIKFLPHPMGSTILVRTLMDRRYFHGIRTFAAQGLAKCATERLRWLGQYHLEKAFHEFFCYADSPMPRANDFSDRQSYLLQCAIPKAMAKIRDAQGKMPLSVRRFFIDKLKFNDNTNNEYSDCYYVATLISCLAESLAASSVTANKYAFSFGNEDDEMDEDTTEEDQSKKEALDEIERYRRIDEWISSYQNTYTVTAIACIERLLKADVFKNRVADILQYTRPGNADNVRVKAFTALVDLKVARKPSVIKYILHSLCDDESPHMRACLLQVFGQALGSIAIGDEQAEAPPLPKADVDSALVLEQEAPATARPVDFARKTSPEGALNALKIIVAEDTVFKTALWHAIGSRTLAISEVVPLLDIAGLLFESTVGPFMVTLPFPRSWKVMRVDSHPMGNFVISFARTSKYRTKPSAHSPLGLEDWNLVQTNGLQYTGPVSKGVKDQQAQGNKATTEAKIVAAQQEPQRQEQVKAQKMSQTATQMSPPPIPVHMEGPGPLKLSLKRKQSVDGGRAGSPKAQKTQKVQTVNGGVATPATQKSPSANKKRSATPVTAPKPLKLSKPKTHIVKLKTSSVMHRVDEILSKPPQRTISLSASRRASQTPLAPSAQQQEDYFPHQPSPPASTPGNNNLFSSPVDFGASQDLRWNVGSFRNYGGSAIPAPVKTEDIDSSEVGPGPISAISPMTQWPPGGPTRESLSPDIPLAVTAASRAASQTAENARATPSAPHGKKLKLKLKPKQPGPNGGQSPAGTTPAQIHHQDRA